MNSSLPEVSKTTARSIGLFANQRLIIAVYGVVTFLFWVSLYIYMPTLSPYVQSKTNDLAMVGVILSMYGLWQAIFRLPLGILTDWLNWRKPFLLAGLALSGIGALVMSSADGSTGLLIGRSLIGLAASTWVVLVVAFTSFFPPDKAVQASAQLTLVCSIARFMSTSSTGFLNQVGGYELSFHIAAAASAIAVLLAFAIPEARRAPVSPSLHKIGKLITNRFVILPAFFNAAQQYVIWSVPSSFLPILARQFGASGVQLSILMSTQIGFMALGNFLASTTLKYVKPRQLVLINFSLLAVSVGIVTIAQSIPLLMVAQVISGIAQGIGYPVLMGMSIETVETESRTTAMGLHQAVYAVGMFAGPWLSGILASAYGLQSMFAVTTLFCVLFAVLSARLLRKPSHP